MKKTIRITTLFLDVGGVLLNEVGIISPAGGRQNISN